MIKHVKSAYEILKGKKTKNPKERLNYKLPLQEKASGEKEMELFLPHFQI